MSSLLEAGVGLIWQLNPICLRSWTSFIFRYVTKVTMGKVWAEALGIQGVYLACKK